MDGQVTWQGRSAPSLPEDRNSPLPPTTRLSCVSVGSQAGHFLSSGLCIRNCNSSSELRLRTDPNVAGLEFSCSGTSNAVGSVSRLRT